MYINNNLDNDAAVGRLGNKLFIIANCGSLNYNKYGSNIKFTPHWKYEKYFPNILTYDTNPNIDSVYNEPKFSYSKIPKIEGNCQINGYFQSEKYFKEMKII